MTKEQIMLSFPRYDRVQYDYGQDVDVPIPDTVDLETGVLSGYLETRYPSGRRVRWGPATLDLAADPPVARYKLVRGDLEEPGSYRVDLRLLRVEDPPGVAVLEYVAVEPLILRVGPYPG